VPKEQKEEFELLQEYPAGDILLASFKIDSEKFRVIFKGGCFLKIGRR
jgi:hypothetical protein